MRPGGHPSNRGSFAALGGLLTKTFTTVSPLWSARGRAYGSILWLEVSREAAAASLPPDLVLLSPSVWRRPTHPVLLMFLTQENVHSVLNPWMNWTYLELVVFVPDVARGCDSSARPHVYMPVLFLDSIVPVFVGQLIFGFPKSLARLHYTEQSFELGALPAISNGSSGDRWLTNRVLKREEPRRPLDYDILQEDMKLGGEQPLLGRSPFDRTHVSPRMKLLDATASALEVELRVSRDFLGLVPPGTYRQEGPGPLLRAFDIEFEWSLDGAVASVNA